MKKGLSDYISHILAIAIAFIILGLVSSSMYDYYIEMTVESQRSEVEAMNEDIRNSIMNLYSEYRYKDIIPPENESEVLGEVEISLTPEIAGGRYRVELHSAEDEWIDFTVKSIFETTTTEVTRPTARITTHVLDFPQRNYTSYLYNIEINLEGNVTSPDDLRLEYVRKNEGEIKDYIRATEISN